MDSSIFDIEFSANKHLVHWDRITDLVNGKDVIPITLEFDVSSHCNHKCIWCVDPAGSHTNKLVPVYLAEKIIKESAELGVKGIIFKGGGEPTLHPDLDKIIKNSYENGFEIGVVTHGGKLNNVNLLKALVNYCSYIRISIDGPTPRSRREIHGVDDFAEMKDGVRKLVELKKLKKNQNGRHPIIGATFCIDSQRQSLIDSCIELGEELDVDYVLIRPPFCEEVGFPAPHNAEEAAILRGEIEKKAFLYKGKLSIMAGNWIGDRELEEVFLGTSRVLGRRDLGIRKSKYNGIEHITGRCLASPLYLVITADLEVYGCCCLRGIKQYSFGTIDYTKGATIVSVLKSQERQQVFSLMKTTECLKYCTHPLAKINELIEYLSLPEKFHSSFI